MSVQPVNHVGSTVRGSAPHQLRPSNGKTHTPVNVPKAPRNIVGRYDANGDGRISRGEHTRTVPPARGAWWSTTIDRSSLFSAADRHGNGNGATSVGEIRRLIRAFDSNSNDRLAGAERRAYVRQYAPARESTIQWGNRPTPGQFALGRRASTVFPKGAPHSVVGENRYGGDPK